MIIPLKYFFHTLASPRRKDFARMGFGIEARYRRCERFWRPHLELSKRFQRRCFEQLPHAGESLVILGAGRLLDAETESLPNRFERVELYDADPSVRSTWRKFARKHGRQEFVVGVVEDISASIESWTNTLDCFLQARPKASNEACAHFLRGLITNPWKFTHSPGCILSLNLLSQIPIYWRDRVRELLQRRWNLLPAAGDEYESPLQQALEATFTSLQTQHLELLKSAGARLIILLTDTDFFYYRNDVALWQREEALFTPLPERIEGYRRLDSDAWLWHLAPQGLECADYGEIHRVKALAWLRND